MDSLARGVAGILCLHRRMQPRHLSAQVLHRVPLCGSWSGDRASRHRLHARDCRSLPPCGEAHPSCMSADPQLLSEEHVQEQEELDDSTPFATEPDRSGVSTSAFGTIRLLAGTRRCCLVMSFISCRRSDASLASLSAPSPRSSIRMMFIDSHQSRVPPTLKTRKTRSNRTFQASYERAFPSRT